MFISYLISGIGFSLFALTTDTFKLGIIVFVMSLASCSFFILLNAAILIEGGKDYRYYVNLSLAIYGIGAILGPVLVNLVGLKSPLIIGVGQAIAGLGFLFFQSP